MMPLRHVAIDLSGVPRPSKRGTPMALERAVVLTQLEPQLDYYPIDIAAIALTYEAATFKPAKFRRLRSGYRHTYANLGERHQLGSNPRLKGRDWQALLGSGSHAVAELMDRLAAHMAQAPGVIFTLDGLELKPYPDQAVRLDLVYLPLEVADKQEEPPATALAPCQPTEADTPPVTQRSGPPASARASRTLRLWPVVLLGLLALVCLPSAVAWYWWQLDEVALAQITELGAPFNDTPYFIANGVRYQVGDRLRIEGQVGVIRELTRDHLIVGDRFYEAPTLRFMGQPMPAEGNVVVYPGSPRHIAGNFIVNRSKDLDKVTYGYLAWGSGFRNRYQHCVDSAEVMAFWAQVRGVAYGCRGSKNLSIPEFTQFDSFLADCAEMGAQLAEEPDYIELVWP